MGMYDVAYALGIAPWERYLRAAGPGIMARLDTEEAERPNPPGRALDLGCGRGLYTAELARRGWRATGIDAVERAITAARRTRTPGTTFVVGDVTDLASQGLGTFDFFLDIGCFQALDRDQSRRMAEGMTALANPDATLLILAFQPTGLLARAGSASPAEVEAAFAAWTLLSVEPAETTGLGWPLNHTSPQWYRLRLRP